MRHQYIDILKGFTIIWVLWMHMNLPELIYPSVQMPIFFFISGMFYQAKALTLWQQLKSDGYKLLLPAFWFSFLAFVIGRNNYLGSTSVIEIINGCLSASIVWFLLALFYFRFLAYICEKSGKNIAVLIIAILLYVPGFYLYANKVYWILPFLPLSHMGAFMIWFAIGFLYGRKILGVVLRPFKSTCLYVTIVFLYVLLVRVSSSMYQITRQI